MRRKRDDELYYEPEIRDEEEPETPEFELTKQERRWVALGALKSALLIGLVYIVGGALLIWLLLTVWG